MKDMVNSDTVKLLQECDAGTKMAVSAIDEVLDDVRDTDMKQLLQESKNHHEKLGNEIRSLLISHGTEEKDPTPIAKGMSWIKTNMKMGMDNSDSRVYIDTYRRNTESKEMPPNNLCKPVIVRWWRI